MTPLQLADVLDLTWPTLDFPTDEIVKEAADKLREMHEMILQFKEEQDDGR